MKVNYWVKCLGYKIDGLSVKFPFEIEVEDKELEGMTEVEKYIHIHEICTEYVTESLEIDLDMDLDEK